MPMLAEPKSGVQTDSPAEAMSLMTSVKTLVAYCITTFNATVVIDLHFSSP
jgi:hypothetical protein